MAAKKKPSPKKAKAPAKKAKPITPAERSLRATKTGGRRPKKISPPPKSKFAVGPNPPDYDKAQDIHDPNDRVDFFANLIASGRWIKKTSARYYANLWGVSVKTTEAYASRAFGLVHSSSTIETVTQTRERYVVTLEAWAAQAAGKGDTAGASRLYSVLARIQGLDQHRAMVDQIVERTKLVLETVQRVLLEELGQEQGSEVSTKVFNEISRLDVDSLARPGSNMRQQIGNRQ